MDFGWKNRNFLVFASIAISCILIWVSELFPMPFFLPFRLLAGVYAISFPLGFLFISIFFQKKEEMPTMEWIAFSIGLSIGIISLSAFFFNIILGTHNSVWDLLRIVFGMGLLLFLIARIREKGGE